MCQCRRCRDRLRVAVYANPRVAQDLGRARRIREWHEWVHRSDRMPLLSKRRRFRGIRCATRMKNDGARGKPGACELTKRVAKLRITNRDQHDRGAA